MIYRVVFSRWRNATCVQQENPSLKISDYPAQGQTSRCEIALSILLNSISLAKGVYIARNHLVLEVAIFPYALDGRQRFEFAVYIARKLQDDSPH